MADNNFGMGVEDPKAAKKKLAADKKEYKKKLKEQRKEQKEKEREFSDRAAELNGDDAGGFATIVITFLIILIWLAIMALLIKLDVGHFGSEILAPLLRDVPVVNLILPEGSTVTTMPNDSQIDSSGEGTSLAGFDSIEDAREYITKLEQSLSKEVSDKNEYQKEIERLKTEVSVLEPYRDEQVKFREEREKFYEEVVFGDNAPDASQYASYYEMIDPDSAAKIYEKIKQSEVDDEAIQAFAKTYSSMKAKSAATIFDQMVEENQIELVAKILAQMSVDNRSSILAAMTKEHSSKLTQLLEPSALEQKSTKVTG